MSAKNWNNGKPSFAYEGHANLGVNLNRQKNAPLDISCEYSSVKDALYYVTEGRYPASGTGVTTNVKDMVKYPYLGQVIALVDVDTEEVSLYYVKTAEYDSTLTTDDAMFNHYFEPVGKATLGDDGSITLSDTGVLSLKDFGKQYYAYNAEKNAYNTTPTTGWKAGLEPRVVASGDTFVLAWYESNPTTVEGLTSKITTIETDIGNAYTSKDTPSTVKEHIAKAEANIDTINDTIGTDATTGTVKGRIKALEDGKAAKATSLEGYGITDAYTKTQVDSKISDLGNVFSLTTSMTSDEFANAKATDYKVGNVILVDGSKEYVVVEKDSTKVFELLGDNQGISAIENRVSKNEESITSINENIKTINNTIGADATAGTVKGRIKALETDVGTNKASIKTNSDAIDTINTKLDTVAEGAQVNILEEVALATDTTGKVTTNGKTATISIDKVASATSADSANKTAAALTFGSKTFDGSKAATLTLSDLGGVASTKVAGETLGLVKTSTGIDKVNVSTDGTMSVDDLGVSKAAVADSANKTKGTLTIGTKTFDGSANVTATASDLLSVATDKATGIVKASSGVDGINVAADGSMTVDTAGVSKAAVASKTTAALTVGSKTFDGSKAVSILLDDIKALGTDARYATAAQGSKADSAIQDIKLDDTSIVTGTTATINSDSLKTALGLGTAAYKADTYFATATKVSTIEGDYLSKAKGGTVAETTTFSKPVVVATPTGDTHATTKKYVDDTIATKIAANDAMTFKGLLGGSGLSDLPTENVKNGDTYKVSVTGTYDSQSAKAGDMFIALVTTSESGTTIKWELIPSADDGDVMASGTLTKDALMVGNDGKEIKTLANGTNNQVLRMVSGKPAWSAGTTVANADGSITVTATGNAYDVKVAKVNVNTLYKDDADTLIFDCGGASDF